MGLVVPQNTLKVPRSQLLVLIQERYNRNPIAGNNANCRFLGVQPFECLPENDHAEAASTASGTRAPQPQRVRERSAATSPSLHQQAETQAETAQLWLHRRCSQGAESPPQNLAASTATV